MRKTLLTTFLLFFAVVTAECQCLINNGMSTYRGASRNGTTLTVNDYVSGSDTMGSGCPIPPTTKHTAHATVTISLAGNPLQNPNFINGTTGWSWGQANPGTGTGGFHIGYGAPFGNGQFGQFSGTGTAALTNLQHISVVPGQTITASATCLGEPGAGGQSLLRIDWYDANLNLLRIDGWGQYCPNNYVWTQLTVTGTAPSNAAIVTVDFAVLNDNVNGPRWAVWGVTARGGVTTTNSYAGCWNCYLSASAAISVPDQGDNWDVTYYSDTICSIAGPVYSETDTRKSPKFTLTNEPNEPYGDTPFLNVLVQDPSGGQGPIGTVKFTVTEGPTLKKYFPDNPISLAVTAAHWVPPVLPVDPYDWIVEYSGDTNYLPDWDRGPSFAINPAPTVTTLNQCPGTVLAGDYPFIVSVARTKPPGASGTVSPITGWVTLYTTPTGANPGTPTGPTRGQAGVSIPITVNLAPGMYDVHASYEGDGNYYAVSSTTSSCIVTAQ